MNGTALLSAPAMSPADKAAPSAASYVRTESLRPAGLKALRNLELATAVILRDRQVGDAARADIAANDGNWIPAYGNWIPNVAPEPEDMWDVAIDAYGTRVLPLTLARSAA